MVTVTSFLQEVGRKRKEDGKKKQRVEEKTWKQCLKERAEIGPGGETKTDQIESDN